jgi:cytochrome c peroxidase
MKRRNGSARPKIYGLSANNSLNFYMIIAAHIALISAIATPVAAQSGSTSKSVNFSSLAIPPNAPAFLSSTYHSALSAPLPNLISPGGIPAVIPQTESDFDPSGIMGTFQPGGATTTASNAFFMSLGTNGRSCFSCHQPLNGMSVGVADLQNRFLVNGVKDPVFAPVDGSNCPNKVPASSTSGSPIGGNLGNIKNTLSNALARTLVLTRGVFRIFLPVPIGAEYSISLVSDPNGCNADPIYNSTTDSAGNKRQVISVYRRPLSSTNLNFALALAPFFPPGIPSGNIMWDGREPSLESQAVDATLGHAQALNPPTTDQVNQIVAFEKGIFSAQSVDTKAGSLTASGATGGPQNLAATPVGGFAVQNSITPYTAWQNLTGAKLSVFRGQQIFNGVTKTFTVSNVAGFNDLVGNPAPGIACSTCHNEVGAGADILPSAQRALGVPGDSPNFNGPSPATDLPIFKLTCPAGSVPYEGSTSGGSTVVTTNDPGAALITGKCTDIGRMTAPPLRGLAGRAPYFHDGSAAKLTDVVNFYNTRFGIGLSSTDIQDVANFLGTL